MGTESEARKRFQNSQYRRQPFQRQRSNQEILATVDLEDSLVLTVQGEMVETAVVAIDHET